MKTCLVVDDSRVIRKVARRILEDLGFEVAEAADGGEAPRVVFCTVENELDRIREALAFGADEYIMKPFDGDIVAGKLALAGAL